MSSDEREARGLVIDNGSYHLRIGHSGDDAPTKAISTNSRTLSLVEGNLHKRTFPYIQHGMVCDWDRMENMLRTAFFDELRAAPEEAQGVMITEKALSPKASREKMTEMMFETFNTNRFFTITDQVLAIYSNGRSSGLNIDIGLDSVNVCPVYEGYVLPHAFQRLKNLGGTLVDTFYAKLLLERGTISLPNGTRELKKLIPSLKAKTICMPDMMVGRDAEMVAVFEGDADAIKTALSRPQGGIVCHSEFELPDKSIIRVDDRDRLLAAMPLLYPELLFSTTKKPPHQTMVEILKRESRTDYCDRAPRTSDFLHREQHQQLLDLIMMDSSNPHEMSHLQQLADGSIKDNDVKVPGVAELSKMTLDLIEIDIRGDLVSNTVLSGGTSMIDGFPRLLEARIKNLYDWESKGTSSRYSRLARVVATPERKYAAWIGGSILTSLSSFESMWMTKTDFEENGPAGVHLKCF